MALLYSRLMSPDRQVNVSYIAFRNPVIKGWASLFPPSPSFYCVYRETYLQACFCSLYTVLLGIGTLLKCREINDEKGHGK